MEIENFPGGGPVLARVSYDVYSPEFKLEMVREWAESGQSQKGFARDHKIPDTTFSGWVKKWRGAGCPGPDGEPASPEPAPLIEVPVPSGRCEIRVGGAVVSFPESALPLVIRELRGRQG